MKPIHNLQLQILKKLLFSESLRYTELKPSETIENNLFQFHLDKLIENNHIEKLNEGYRLTKAGKEFANRMDTDQTKIIKQAKIGVMFCCMRNINGEKEYLVYNRLKQPFYGYQGFPTGKVQYGESIIDCAERELMEETGLEGKPELVYIYHMRVFSPEKELLEDKFLYMCRIMNPKGTLIESVEGTNEWVRASMLKKYLKKPFQDMPKSIDLITNFKGQISFEEEIHIVDDF